MPTLSYKPGWNEITQNIIMALIRSRTKAQSYSDYFDVSVQEVNETPPSYINATTKQLYAHFTTVDCGLFYKARWNKYTQ